MTQRGVVYVTKMKKNLKYGIQSDTMYQTPQGLMEIRIRQVTFSKQLKDGETLTHQVRVITYADEKKAQTHILTCQRYGTRPVGNHLHLPQTMGNRVAVMQKGLTRSWSLEYEKRNLTTEYHEPRHTSCILMSFIGQQ
ncbi:hypothetical protein [Parabacteroides distasonis]|uniref:hypothetical protein n=1 Tax=Parabacteroides distasonis TaxID=823 RepID=UPI00189F22D9|nr:hypothetical protein [Parabacteroides distasonis]MDB9150967.1 hypothetical protein [Parabacteroides distasonis]MDB9155477.1 hypothetical protein [Parabacteroides distasonis]MDB9163725.1 hypothetical protein [Parabacteroides distasonis]MDB9168031.1 hypothetical protein [Parabacteroides distasonis]MDB9196795.1 hypothetical protein [Parabacteroides distasonis]